MWECTLGLAPGIFICSYGYLFFKVHKNFFLENETTFRFKTHVLSKEIKNKNIDNFLR